MVQYHRAEQDNIFNDVRQFSYIIGNIIGLMSLIVLLFCFVLSYFMMQAAYVKVKELLYKQFRYIYIRHKWIKRRIYRDGMQALQFLNKVLDCLFLSAKTIGAHSVMFIISYTIPLLLVFAILQYKDSVNERKEVDKECIDKENLIEKQRMQIKSLQDSLFVLEKEYIKYTMENRKQ